MSKTIEELITAKEQELGLGETATKLEIRVRSSILKSSKTAN